MPVLISFKDLVEHASQRVRVKKVGRKTDTRPSVQRRRRPRH